MDWARIQANWKHFKASARARWEMITLDELDMIGGRRELLTGHIEEVFGMEFIFLSLFFGWSGGLFPPAWLFAFCEFMFSSFSTVDFG